MTDKVQTHSLERTSPTGPGQMFIGYCRLCGQQGLTLKDMNKSCQNPRKLTADEAVLDAIEGDRK